MSELYTETVLREAGSQSLAWHDDGLVDWGKRFGPGYDGAIAAADGKHVAVYQKLGTHGLLLRDGEPVRELTRSAYHADKYEYPVAFVRLPDGRTGLVHCPTEYSRIDIDDVATGERLTDGNRKPADVFHSRLAASPSSKRLLSAGWVWQPRDVVRLFDVAAASDPARLDEGTLVGSAPEPAAATWLDDDRLVIAASDEPGEGSRSLSMFDVAAETRVSSVALPEIAGTLMAAGPRHVVSFYREPKLLELATGREVHRWAGLFSGTQASSIIWAQRVPVPPMALDPARGRFAVAGAHGITVVELHLGKL